MLSSLGRLAFAGAVGSVLSVSGFAQGTLGCTTGGPGGPFPTAGTGDGTFQTILPTAPLIQTLAVTSIPAGATVLTELQLHGMTHTYVSDCHFVLEDPSGTKHNIFCRPPGSCNFGGDYTIVAQCSGGMTPLATCTTTFPAGTYEQYFGAWVSGGNSIVNTPLDTIPAATGNWTLYIYDWVAADIGTLTSWDLCFGNPSVTTGLATLTAPANGTIVNSPTALAWGAASCATQYSIEVDGTIYGPQAGLTYSFAGAVGTHMWRVRSETASLLGPWTALSSFDFPVPPPPCTELGTIFTAGNGGGLGGQVFFDMSVLTPGGITLEEISVNTGEAGSFTIDVYTRPTTYVGFNGSVTGWTLLTSGTGTGAGVNAPSLADVADVIIPAGTYGVSLVLGLSHGFDYTNGTGANQNYSNAELALALGAAQNAPWNNALFTPRVWNGIIHYACVIGMPVPYCTAGTSTHGCNAMISADHNPSVAQSNPCNISLNNVEGQKFGIVFYGINQMGFIPSQWANGSTSFLCVKGPTQRTGTGNSGGTIDLCDGVLGLDWNAYQTANPGAVGNPWAVGNKVYVQGWYRDPPAPKTTNLSDALEMTYVP